MHSVPIYVLAVTHWL